MFGLSSCQLYNTLYVYLYNVVDRSTEDPDECIYGQVLSDMVPTPSPTPQPSLDIRNTVTTDKVSLSQMNESKINQCEERNTAQQNGNKKEEKDEERHDKNEEEKNKEEEKEKNQDKKGKEEGDPINTDISNRLVYPGDILGSVSGSYEEIKKENDDRENYRARFEFYIWAILFIILSIIVWVIVIVDSYTHTHNSSSGSGTSLSHSHNDINNINTDFIRSVALAPFGALLRYALWHVPTITPYVTARFPHMKVPTLIANVCGTVFFSAAVTFDRDLYSSAFTTGE